MGHIHSIYDTDPHFKIDPVTRVITNMSETKTCIVQGDHNSERFTFECPRFIDGHDMSTCNQVQVHYINMDQAPREEHYGLYEVEDLDLSPEDENVVIFSWLISENATRYVGPLSFVVNFVCKTGTTIDYAWNTAIHADINVVTGINSGEPIIVEYADIMEAWKRELAAQQIVSMTQTKVGELDGGENVWTATFGNGMTANFVVRNGHAGQTNPAGTNYGSVKSGGDVTIENGIISVNWPSVDSGIAYSKTVPRGASDVAEIKKIGGMTRKCTNLLPYPYDDTTKTANGITFTDNGDGSITVNGTATADAVFNLSRVLIKAEQKYFASGCPLGGSQTTYYLLPRGFGKDTGNGVLLNGTSSDFSSLSQIVVTSGTTVNNLVFKPMLNAGSSALPYEPYFEGLRSAPVSAVESVGANMIKFPYAEPTKTNYGITWTVNPDGSVTANGTATDVSTFYLMTEANPASLSSGEYFFKCGGDTYATFFGRVVLLRSDGNFVNENDYGNGCKITLNDGDKFYILLRVQKGITVSNLTFYPMLNKGTTALPYTPYFKRTLEIPEAVQALDGYGEGNPDDAEEYNAIICENGKWKYSHKGDIEDNVWTPLAAHENTDISDILPADNFIEVEGGGTVTMVNEYGYDVPSVVDFSANADVRVIPQSLTASQKEQARANIGIHVVDSLPSDLSDYAVGDILLVAE